MKRLLSAALALQLLACSTAERPPGDGSVASGADSKDPGGTAYAHLDELLPWAFSVAHEMAADLDIEGDWSRLALQRFVLADPISGLQRFTFINRATVRVEGGHVKYSILRFDLGESSLTNVVTSDKGLIVHDGRDEAERARTVNDFADFESLAPSSAVAAAEAHLRAAGATEVPPLARFEFEYFARPQHLELEFDSPGGGAPGPVVRLGTSGEVLGR